MTICVWWVLMLVFSWIYWLFLIRHKSAVKWFWFVESKEKRQNNLSIDSPERSFQFVFDVISILKTSRELDRNIKHCAMFRCLSQHYSLISHRLRLVSTSYVFHFQLSSIVKFVEGRSSFRDLEKYFRTWSKETKR